MYNSLPLEDRILAITILICILVVICLLIICCVRRCIHIKKMGKLSRVKVIAEQKSDAKIANSIAIEPRIFTGDGCDDSEKLFHVPVKRGWSGTLPSVRISTLSSEIVCSALQSVLVDNMLDSEYPPNSPTLEEQIMDEEKEIHPHHSFSPPFVFIDDKVGKRESVKIQLMMFPEGF